MSGPLLGPARRMFDLALGEMLWGRRAVFMGLAAGAPILLAVVARLTLAGGSAVLVVNVSRIDSEAMFGTAVSLLYLRFIVPALGVDRGQVDPEALAIFEPDARIGAGIEEHAALLGALTAGN